MYSNQYKWIQIAQITLDCIISIASFILAGILRFANFQTFIDTISFKEFVLVIIIGSIISFVASGMYRNFFKRGYFHEFNRVFIYSFIIILLLPLYYFITKNDMALPRLTLLYFFIINLILIYITHIIIKKVYRIYMHGSRAWKLLVVVDSDSLDSTCWNIQNSSLKDRVTGVFVLDHQVEHPASLNGIPLITPPNTIIDYIIQNPMDEVLLSIVESRYVSDEIQTLRNQIVQSGTMFSLRLWPIIKDEPYVFRLTEFGNDYIMSFSDRKYNYLLILCKRIMDVIGSIIGLLITAVLSIFLIPAILIDSPGPVFFKQKRVGRNGRIFTIFKFRSMYKDAEDRKAALLENNEMKGLLFKIEDDPRITKVGKFIRKASLDEFPQFLNVLKGDMSLVGTRPPTLDEYKQYTYTQKKRLCFRPGITGIWQTSGRNNITDFNDVLQMDLKYIRDWSIYLDIKILLKTVLVVLLRKGAH